MDELQGKIEGNYRVVRDLTMHGMFAGDVTVNTGATLILRGMVCNDLHVEHGAKAVVHGMISGGVYNRGGEIIIYGMVIGEIATDPFGKTKVEPGASVNYAP